MALSALCISSTFPFFCFCYKMMVTASHKWVMFCGLDKFPQLIIVSWLSLWLFLGLVFMLNLIQRQCSHIYFLVTSIGNCISIGLLDFFTYLFSQAHQLVLMFTLCLILIENIFLMDCQLSFYGGFAICRWNFYFVFHCKI